MQFVNYLVPKEYSKTSVKRPLKNRQKKKILMTNGSLMKVESIAECSPWSILQYLWPTLSDNWSWKPIFGLWEWLFYTGFTVHIRVLYPHFFHPHNETHNKLMEKTTHKAYSVHL